MKPTVCKHCKAINSHYSFQCSLIRKPIKSTSSKTEPKKDKDSLSELLKLAEIVFNKWIRNRDTHYDGSFVCMCCKKSFKVTEMDAGHFISKLSSALRFNENNVWGCCKTCNQYMDGNLVEYRKNLIVKIGEKKVLELEKLSRSSHKWEKEYLLKIINKYKI